jgi:hypothetical protein
MIRLEALKAKHGDCLLLHWGSGKKIATALIDGGPSAVYKDFLRPRLEELAQQRGDTLALDLVMLSHIDDDHINGLLDLSKELKDGDGPDVAIRRLWHNSLEGLLGDPLVDHASTAATAAVGAALMRPPATWSPNKPSDVYTGKVLASVPQGQQLAADAKLLEWKVNPGFAKGLVMRAQGQKPLTIAGLRLTIVGPAVKEVEALRKTWKAKRKKGITAAYSDPSVYNLSSIVVLAEFGKRRLLLTGDARGDHILQGLAALKKLKKGKLHVDLLKLPHHGSKNNLELDFFERITADHYVVSGDRVKFPNPAKEAMRWLRDARGDDDYRVYCPYEVADMRKLFGARLVTPKTGQSRVEVTL